MELHIIIYNENNEILLDEKFDAKENFSVSVRNDLNILEFRDFLFRPIVPMVMSSHRTLAYVDGQEIFIDTIAPYYASNIVKYKFI